MIYTTIHDLVHTEIVPALEAGESTTVDLDALVDELRDTGAIQWVSHPGHAERDGYRLANDPETFWAAVERHVLPDPVVSSVDSTNGHRFITEYDTEEVCIMCGALYVLVPDDTDRTHGRYETITGDPIEWCTGDTKKLHGYERWCTDCESEDCVHAVAPCDCMRCN